MLTVDEILTRMKASLSNKAIEILNGQTDKVIVLMFCGHEKEIQVKGKKMKGIDRRTLKLYPG